MRIVFLLCAAFVLSVASEPMKAKVAVQLNKTQDEGPEALLTQMAGRMTKVKPLPVTEAGSTILGDMRQSGDSCLPYWHKYGSRCFKFFTTSMNWIDAENYCLYFGANLVSIHNPGEYEFIMELALRNNCPRTWIGGSDAVKSLKWLWSDGSIVYYNNWARGEPNDSKGRENCIEMISKGWNDLNCEVSLPFVCGTRPDGPI